MHRFISEKESLPVTPEKISLFYWLTDSLPHCNQIAFGLALMMGRLVVLSPFCGLSSSKAGLTRCESHAYQKKKWNHFQGRRFKLLP
jgi:hypothetical protein